MPDVWCCSVPGWPASAPALQVLAIKHDEAPGLSPEVARQVARQRVREVLQAYAGATALAHLRTSPREAPAPGPVAISHEPGLSLLAWCGHGHLGIDLVDVAPLRALPVDELAATATLFLGPDGWAHAPPPADPAVRFAQAWAQHEARLKCLGLGLTEWCASHQATLTACPAWPVTLPAADAAADPARWVGWLAWRGV